MQVDIERGRWIDPTGTDVALATWAEEPLSRARRLSPSTQETYARRMGHSSINVTLDRHGHLFSELDEAIAAGCRARIAEARRLRNAS
jgi:integrase